jgi:anti-sigma factor RsiW
MMCNEIQPLISAFVDAQLRSEDTSSVFEHIGSCSACRDFLQGSIRMRAMIARIPSPPVPPGLDARVLEIPLTPHRIPRPRRLGSLPVSLWQRRLRVPLPALAAGLTLFILTTALSLWLWLNPLRAPKQEVVYVFGMPQVEVYGTQAANPPGERKQQ